LLEKDKNENCKLKLEFSSEQIPFLNKIISTGKGILQIIGQNGSLILKEIKANF